MYLFAIIGVYSRYLVGWGLSNTMSAEWCVETIKQAISIHGEPEIINSDQAMPTLYSQKKKMRKEFVNI